MQSLRAAKLPLWLLSLAFFAFVHFSQGLLPQRHKYRQAGLRSNFAGDVPLAGDILGNEDVSGAEAPHRAISDLNVHRP